jgi:hypothetical protein
VSEVSKLNILATRNDYGEKHFSFFIFHFSLPIGGHFTPEGTPFMSEGTPFMPEGTPCILKGTKITVKKPPDARYGATGGQKINRCKE